MKWMEKKATMQFIQAKCFGIKGLSPRRKQNGSPNHVPSGKETKLPQGAISLGEKGIKFPKGVISP
jgi:hypothetical protein